MKNKNFKLFTAVKALVLVAFVSFNFSSCSPDDNTEDTTASKLSIKETFDALNRAPAPGNSSIAGIAVDAGFNELVSALVYVDTELDAGLELVGADFDQLIEAIDTDALGRRCVNREERVKLLRCLVNREILRVAERLTQSDRGQNGADKAQLLHGAFELLDRLGDRLQRNERHSF